MSLSTAFCFVLLFLFSGKAIAQASFTGGAGDGYGKSSYTYLRGDPPGMETAVLVFPNAVGQGQSFSVRASGLHNKLEIRVWTLQGQQLHRNVAWGITGEYEERISTEGWAAGVYIVDVRRDGRTFRYKLVVLQE